MKQAILTALQNLRLDAEILCVRTAPQFSRVELKCFQPLDKELLDELSFQISIALNCFDKPTLSYDGQLLSIDVPNETRRVVTLDSLPVAKKQGAIVLPLGEGLDGQKYDFDLCKAPHVWLAGATGTGKSTLQQAWLATLVKEYADEVQLVLIDPKRVEFGDWARTDLLFHGLYAVDCPQTLAALETLLAEMERRYDALSKVGVRNIHEYNERANIPLKKIVVMIDECSSFQYFGERKVFMLLQSLLQKCRSAGIYFVIATQCDFGGETAFVLENVPTRVAFKMSARWDSRSFLGDGAATSLLGKGDAIVQNPDGTRCRVQTPWVG